MFGDIAKLVISDMMPSLSDLNVAIRENFNWIELLRTNIGHVIIGQKYMIDRMLVGLLTGGHVLLEGMPGLGKTLAIKTLAMSMDAMFKRIQFTPDMLPSDIVGMQVYNQKTCDFFVQKGPVFANIILADEINRAPAKVQSALLECMQEHHITISGITYGLPEFFSVFATENPIDHEGTYPLPESQIDRFLLKLKIEYPSKLEEINIVRNAVSGVQESDVKQVITMDVILKARQLVNAIYIDDKIQEYIVDIVTATRDPDSYKLDIAQYIQYGASPRATVALALASRAWAFLQGRGYVIPQDVKSVGIDVLRHRIITSYLADAENIAGEVLAARIINTIRVP